MTLSSVGRVGALDACAELSEALARLRAAAAAEAIWPGVKEFAAHFGYVHILAVDLSRIAGGAVDCSLYSDAPYFLSAFDQELVAIEHPVIRKCLEAPNTFLISEIRNAPAHRGARWIEFMANVVRYGEGLVVPVYRAGQPIAAVNFGGEKPDVSPLTRALLQVVSHAAVERALDLRGGKRSTVNILSPREAQCLTQVAIGRPDAEIGQLLGISARTVRFHVDSAKAKMGVSTRVQAVAKAFRERIIAL